VAKELRSYFEIWLCILFWILLKNRTLELYVKMEKMLF